LKSNRLCTGYQRQHVFINNQNLPNARIQFETKQGNTQSEDTKLTTSPPHSDPGSRNGKQTQSQKKAARKFNPSTNVSVVPAYRQMLFDCFFRSYVPVDELGPREATNWLTSLMALPNLPPCLSTAMLAISLSKVGKVNSDSHLGKESLRQYIRGLRELQAALDNPEHVYTDETLAACLLLGMYELIECPDGDIKAYASHNNGCARLIQLRGPKAFQQGISHSLFVAIRMQCVSPLQILHEINRTNISRSFNRLTATNQPS
jgi:Fungal specific transcription factor domain